MNAKTTAGAKATKTYYATRDFTDAGAERSFKLNEKIENVKEGQLANYIAARLVSTEKAEAPATETSGPAA